VGAEVLRKDLTETCTAVYCVAEREVSVVPELFIDFRLVKERVSIETVLDHYGIRLRRINQNSLRGKCPLPTHSSKESKESFCVNTDKNIWACQSSSCSSARQNKKGGNIIDFVALMERSSIRDAAVKLHDWFLSSPSPPPKVGEPAAPAETQTGKLVSENNSGAENAKVNTPLSFTLKDVDCTHPYVRSRGLSDATAKHFGVGFFPGKGSMSSRCVVPIHNEKGELIAYAGRAIDATEPKYKLPAGFHKNQVLYNLHRAVEVGERGLIVVEGFFDAISVSQAGYPFVVALMGCSLSDEQERLLISHTDQVVILLDGDEAGRAGAESIAARLVHHVFVKIVSLADGQQPDQLSSAEITSILSA
jgi:DNA primase